MLVIENKSKNLTRKKYPFFYLAVTTVKHLVILLDICRSVHGYTHTHTHTHLGIPMHAIRNLLSF